MVVQKPRTIKRRLIQFISDSRHQQIIQLHHESCDNKIFSAFLVQLQGSRGGPGKLSAAAAGEVHVCCHEPYVLQNIANLK